MEVNKYYNDTKDKIAILVSKGYGAGWSTWNREELAFDARVVEFYLMNKNKKDKMEKQFSNVSPDIKNQFLNWGYNDVYFGGFSQIQIEWIPIGTKFRIEEYDGYEYIVFEKNEKWLTA